MSTHTLTLAEQFGLDSMEGIDSDEEKYFTKISDDLRKGTKKDTYDPFFEMDQASRTSQFLADTSSVGTTKSGESMNFAGSTSQNIQMDQRKDAYATASVKQEEAVQNKMSEAKSVMAGIGKSNKSSLMQLAQMKQNEDDDEGGGFLGTKWICSRLKKEGIVSSKESLKMTKFFIKFLVAHPALAEAYITHAPKLIKKADEDGFDWNDESLKYHFITNVLNLADSDKWELAYREYFDTYMELCDKVGIDVPYNKKLWNMGIFGSIKYWIRMFRNRHFVNSIGKMVYISYRMRRI